MSNCIIKLSGDKDRVIAEAFRVLKLAGGWPCPTWSERPRSPRGRAGPAWDSGWAVALTHIKEDSDREKLARARFGAIDVEPTRLYRAADAKQFLADANDDVLAQIIGRLMSAFVRPRGSDSDALQVNVLCLTAWADRT